MWECREFGERGRIRDRHKQKAPWGLRQVPSRSRALFPRSTSTKSTILSPNVKDKYPYSICFQGEGLYLTIVLIEA
jgi:hypothetical protein